LPEPDEEILLYQACCPHPDEDPPAKVYSLIHPIAKDSPTDEAGSSLKQHSPTIRVRTFVITVKMRCHQMPE